jgi:hypothetical protein
MKPTSPKTTFLAIAALIQAAIACAIAVFDGDAATSPDWASLGMVATVAFGLIFARDNKTSDQKAGARPEPVAPELDRAA